MTTAGAAKDKQWLLLGPWDHELTTSTTQRVGELDIGSAADTTYTDTIFAFFESCLNDVDNGFDERPPVSHFTLVRNKWREAQSWPPGNVVFEDWYLSGSGSANGGTADGKLSIVPPESATPARFEYDPDNPVSLSASFDNWSVARHLPDRRVVEERDDVLFYDSAPLDADLTISGPLRVVLYASSTATDTDFVSTLVDVHPDGYAHEVQHGIVRASFRNGDGERALLEPGTIYEFTIDLWSTSYQFREGHKIRLEITSSDFDRYDRNLNTGDMPGISSRRQRATQIVYHDEQHPSRILLPKETEAGYRH
jgi:hypothetical protein